MTCLECLTLLNEGLDAGVVDPTGAAEHLRHCSNCRALFALAGPMERTVRLAPPPASSAEFTARLTRVVLADRRQTRTWSRLRRGASVTLALAAAVLVVVTWRGVSPPPKAMDPSRGNETPLLSVAEPPLGTQMSEATEAMASLTRRTADVPLEAGRLFLSPLVSSPEEAPAMGEDAASVESLRHASEGVSAGLEPVAASARRAVTLFLRDLPGGSGRRQGL